MVATANTIVAIDSTRSFEPHNPLPLAFFTITPRYKSSRNYDSHASPPRNGSPGTHVVDEDVPH